MFDNKPHRYGIVKRVFVAYPGLAERRGVTELSLSPEGCDRLVNCANMQSLQLHGVQAIFTCINQERAGTSTFQHVKTLCLKLYADAVNSSFGADLTRFLQSLQGLQSLHIDDGGGYSYPNLSVVIKRNFSEIIIGTLPQVRTLGLRKTESVISAEEMAKLLQLLPQLSHLSLFAFGGLEHDALRHTRGTAIGSLGIGTRSLDMPGVLSSLRDETIMPRMRYVPRLRLTGLNDTLLGRGKRQGIVLTDVFEDIVRGMQGRGLQEGGHGGTYDELREQLARD